MPCPENGPAIGDYMLESPRLDYRFKVDQPGTYYIWMRGIGRWWLSNSIYVAIDGKQPQKAYPGWENLTYRWKHCSDMDSNKPLETITDRCARVSIRSTCGCARTAAAWTRSF